MIVVQYFIIFYDWFVEKREQLTSRLKTWSLLIHKNKVTRKTWLGKKYNFLHQSFLSEITSKGSSWRVVLENTPLGGINYKSSAPPKSLLKGYFYTMSTLANVLENNILSKLKSDGTALNSEFVWGFLEFS